LSSVKLALILLGILILIVIPATIIPQGLGTEQYLEGYGLNLGSAIVLLGYDQFFNSPLFLTVTGLLGLNLAGCTTKRFIRQLKGKKKDFGPDILHIGLLLLILSGLLTSLSSQSVLIYLAPGEGVTLEENLLLGLASFDFHTYQDGRPKDWISHVVLGDSNWNTLKEQDIQVNQPLRYEGLTIYQSSYRQGQQEGQWESGLLIKSDKSTPFVYISFSLISLGLVLTYYKRMKK